MHSQNHWMFNTRKSFRRQRVGSRHHYCIGSTFLTSIAIQILKAQGGSWELGKPKRISRENWFGIGKICSKYSLINQCNRTSYNHPMNPENWELLFYIYGERRTEASYWPHKYKIICLLCTGQNSRQCGSLYLCYYGRSEVPELYSNGYSLLLIPIFSFFWNWSQLFANVFVLIFLRCGVSISGFTWTRFPEVLGYKWFGDVRILALDEVIKAFTIREVLFMAVGWHNIEAPALLKAAVPANLSKYKHYTANVKIVGSSKANEDYAATNFPINKINPSYRSLPHVLALLNMILILVFEVFSNNIGTRNM